ncbi:hypothetical protein B0H14DRAFT_2623333 [Mycena olivaceomarginata]|nr:hypothetical protein B0H14DRAFT_2623333 [Mycena olivaceomarginata]
MPNSAGLSEPETFPVSHCRKYKEAADSNGTKKNGSHAGQWIREVGGFMLTQFQGRWLIGNLLKRAYEFEKAAAILRAQVPHRNKLWMSSIVSRDRDIGRDVGQSVADIGRFERTSHARDPTWARPGDKEARLHM